MGRSDVPFDVRYSPYCDIDRLQVSLAALRLRSSETSLKVGVTPNLGNLVQAGNTAAAHTPPYQECFSSAIVCSVLADALRGSSSYTVPSLGSFRICLTIQAGGFIVSEVQNDAWR